MIVSYDSKKQNPLLKIAETFGTISQNRREVTAVELNPKDYYMLRTDPVFVQQFDSETQRRLIRQGLVGYLWGAIVKIAWDLEIGKIRFRTEKLPEPEEL
jgi:hypothetical protein